MSEKSQPTVAAVAEENFEARVKVASIGEEAVHEQAEPSAKAEAAGSDTTGPETIEPETIEPETIEERADDGEERRARNAENLNNVGTIHGVVVVAALALFGAAHTWAEASGWLLAGMVAVATAFVAGIVISSISHEWGHYTGAILSGSTHKVARKPVNYFFMFDFDIPANSVRQALWMSCGGLAGSWLLLVVVALLVPMDSWASAVLAATILGQAVNASVFEVPIILRTGKSQEFQQELSARLESPGVVKVPGLIVGLLAFAVLT